MNTDQYLVVVTNYDQCHTVIAIYAQKQQSS